MIKPTIKKSRFFQLLFTLYLWVLAFVDLGKFFKSWPRFTNYLRDWYKYNQMPGSESIRFINTYPRIHDRLQDTPIDPHYFYQDIWAFNKINKNRPSSHVDVGSGKQFVGFLTTVTNVKFVDIRPLAARLQNLEQIKGSILKLPFADNSIKSLSCLHVAEHIGLGRYGDALDPEGTKKACAELMRVLAPGGMLYFSLPVGMPKVRFNAHRIHSPVQILEYFTGLELVQFSAINDEGMFNETADIVQLGQADYSCGLFIFTKK